MPLVHVPCCLRCVPGPPSSGWAPVCHKVCSDACRKKLGPVSTESVFRPRPVTVVQLAPELVEYLPTVTTARLVYA